MDLKKKQLGKGVRVVVCFFRIFYFIGWGKEDFWTWCGEWIVHVHLDSGLSVQVYLGAGGGGIYFHFSQWEGSRCLAHIPFKFGGREGFFFHFSLFPNVFSRCSL